MTLLIAILLIIHMDLSINWCALAVVLWALHIAFHVETKTK